MSQQEECITTEEDRVISVEYATEEQLTCKKCNENRFYTVCDMCIQNICKKCIEDCLRYQDMTLCQNCIPELMKKNLEELMDYVNEDSVSDVNELSNKIEEKMKI